MKYYRVVSPDGDRLVVADGADAYDLTAARDRLRSFGDLARAADVCDRSIDEVASGLLPEAEPVSLEERRDDLAEPTGAGEVWAAGVTYKISEEAREAESALPDVYMDVYESERPEVFFKATPSRTVGPGEDIGVRADSDWDVPEPELAIVLYDGDIVGFTVGNDVSSRAIEGQNPLYLPQAKTYDRCCAVGPCVASAASIADPHDLTISMTIERDEETLFADSTNTAKMVHDCEELVSYYERHNVVPEVAVLLTGTALVPEEMTLQPGDVVHIDIEDIGGLTNSVRTV